MQKWSCASQMRVHEGQRAMGRVPVYDCVEYSKSESGPPGQYTQTPPVVAMCGHLRDKVWMRTHTSATQHCNEWAAEDQMQDDTQKSRHTLLCVCLD